MIFNMIIDAHLHLSYLDKNTKDFLDVKNDLTISMKNNSIDYAVVIPDNVPNLQCADTPTLLNIVQNEKRFFMMGTVNVFQDIDKQINSLRQLLLSKKICGIKLFPGHNPFYLTDERCKPVYELCEKHNIPVVIHTGASSKNKECAKYNDPKDIVKIVNDYKKLKVVITHFFFPEMEYCYNLTKDFQNIYYDTSAMADTEVIEESGGWDKVVDVLRRTALLKPDNILFGTDWPMCSVGEHTKLIKALKLDKNSEEKIFFKNAINLYELDIS